MYRYLVFAWDTYYPNGGWRDFKGSFLTVEDARIWIGDHSGYDRYQIIDTKTGREVA